MAGPYYVDLSLGTTGTPGTSSTAPWGFDDFRTAFPGIASPSDVYLKGTTLYNNSINLVNVNITLKCWDTTVNAQGVDEPWRIAATLTTISIYMPGTWVAGVNTQWGWTAPAMPAWNDLQASFSSILLSTGINTPPEPGTSPYTEYPVGLWRTSRIGIGAMDFIAVPPPPPTPPAAATLVYRSGRTLSNNTIYDRFEAA